MRAVELRADGTPEVSSAILKFSKDRNRYARFRDGESIEDICVKDNIDPEKAIHSIRQGRLYVEAEQLLEIRDLKHSGAVANERMRQKARVQSEPLILDGLEKLLKGQRTITSVDTETGEILTEVIDDPEVISMGLEHARKILSIDERPAPNQTIVSINHNQQNNFGDDQRPTAQTYEERLKRIRNLQIGKGQREPEVLEAEIVDVESGGDAEPAPAPESKDWENF